jgi:alkyl hydroperoxide reductase subunit AhpC
VLAISVDHIFALNVFNASLGMLPYPLVSDWHKTTAEAYGVLNTDDLVAKRSVFIIDKQGILRYQNLEFKALESRQYEEAMDQLELLQSR